MPDETPGAGGPPAPPPHRRFLVVALACALVAMLLVLRGTPDRRTHAAWAVLTLASAAGMLLHERELRRGGRPSRALRWAAIGVGAAALLQLARIAA